MLKKYLIYIPFSVLLTCVLYQLYYTLSFNNFPTITDGATVLLLGKEVAGGNVLLRGWELSTVPFYFTEVVIYALSSLIVGYSKSLAFVIPSILYVVIIWLMFSLSKNKLLSISLLTFFVVFPADMAVTSMLSACIHMGTYAFIFASIILLEKYDATENIVNLIIATIISALSLFSDNISMFIYIIPMILASTVMFAKHREKKYLTLAFSAVVSILISKLIKYGFSVQNGFHLPGINDIRVVTYENISNNINTAIQGTLLFFNANIFGQPLKLSYDTFSIFSRFLGFLALIYFAAKRALRFRCLSFTDILIISSIVLMLAAYVGSNLPRNIWTIRYLVPVYLMLVIFVSREKYENKYILLSVFFAGMASGVSTINIQESNEKHDQFACISEKIKQSGGEFGYATFDYTNSVGIDSTLKIANIKFENGKVVRDRWLTNNEWYNKGNNFFILPDDTQVNIVKTEFGTPHSIEYVCNVFILTYDKN
ncbi:hypothetical protein, partial [Enterobacter hormaechei]